MKMSKSDIIIMVFFASLAILVISAIFVNKYINYQIYQECLQNENKEVREGCVWIIRGK